MSEKLGMKLAIAAHGLSHGICLYPVMITLHFLNDVTNDAESTQKVATYVIIASLEMKQRVD